TVLISSTFTKRLSLAFNEELFEEIKRLCHTNKYAFQVVLHPKLPEEIKDRFKNLQAPNYTYFDTTELNPLFRQSDIMLSDTTSAISEFVMRRKVVVTFRNNRPDDYFINIQEVKELETALDKALTRPHNVLQHIETYIQETHPYVDGKSSVRIIDACIAFVRRDKSYLKDKPWNLIRKWKLRKKLRYFTLKSYNKPFTLNLCLPVKK